MRTTQKNVFTRHADGSMTVLLNAEAVKAMEELNEIANKQHPRIQEGMKLRDATKVALALINVAGVDSPQDKANLKLLEAALEMLEQELQELTELRPSALISGMLQAYAEIAMEEMASESHSAESIVFKAKLDMMKH